MHLDNPSNNFDSIFVFNLYDKMKQFKEQDSYAGNLEEDFLIKDNNIKECLKQIGGFQKAVVDNQFKTNIIIKGKEEMYAELYKEFDRINDATIKEMETMRVMFTKDLEKSKVEHNELRDELKKRPLVLNIPPLKT